MWDKPPTKEDTLVGTSLRRSSQRTSHEATHTLDRWWMKGVATKATNNTGPTRGQLSISPQLLGPSTSDPPYVPVPEPKSSGTDDLLRVMWILVHP